MSKENTTIHTDEMIPFTSTNEATQIVEGIRNAASDIFHSFDVVTHEDRAKLYNAMAGDGQSVKENLNKILEIVDVVIMPVDVINDDGTISTVPRTTLITSKGEFISASSWGVYNSVRKLAGVFGGLHFDNPVKLTPVEVKTKNGFTMNLKMV